MLSVKLSDACDYAPKAHKAACVFCLPHDIAWRTDKAAAPLLDRKKHTVQIIASCSGISYLQSTGCDQTWCSQARAWR